MPKHLNYILILIALLTVIVTPIHAQDEPCDSTTNYEEDGIARVNQAQFQEAIPLLTCAIEFDPENHLLYFYRGGAYLSLNDYDNALTDFDSLLALLETDNPMYFQVRYTRGFVHNQLDNHDLAVDDLTYVIETLLASDPNNGEALVPAYQLRALSYRLLAEYDNAIADYTQAIALARIDVATLYAARGFVYYEMGDTDNATNDWQTALDLAPTITEAYRASIVEQWEADRYDDALRTINDAITLDTFNDMVVWENYAIRAATYNALAEYDLALEDVEQVLTLIDFEESIADAGYLLVIRAEAYLGLEEYDLALADANEYVEIDARDPEVYRIRGDIYYETGNYEQARINYEIYERARTGLIDEQTQARLTELRALDEEDEEQLNNLSYG